MHVPKLLRNGGVGTVGPMTGSIPVKLSSFEGRRGWMRLQNAEERTSYGDTFDTDGAFTFAFSFAPLPVVLTSTPNATHARPPASSPNYHRPKTSINRHLHNKRTGLSTRKKTYLEESGSEGVSKASNLPLHPAPEGGHRDRRRD